MTTRQEALSYGMTFPDEEIRRMIAESYDLICRKKRKTSEK